MFCDNCGILLGEKDAQFDIKIEIFAKPGDLNFTADEIAEDHITRMNEIIRELEKMSEEEAAERTDEVWERYDFTLCRRCRDEFHEKLKLRTKKGF